MNDSNNFYFVAQDILSTTTSDEFADILNITIKKDRPIEYDKIVKNKNNKSQQIRDLLNCYDTLSLRPDNFIERLEAARSSAMKNIVKAIKEQIEPTTNIEPSTQSKNQSSREIDPLDTDKYRGYSVGEPTKLEKIRELQRWEFERIRQEIDVAIITATSIETDWFLEYLESYFGENSVLKFFNNDTYLIGKYAKYNAVHVQCRMGIVGAILSTFDVIDLWLPKAIFMVGIAFGKGFENQKQKYGDILISKEIILYDQEYVGDNNGKEKKAPFPTHMRCKGQLLSAANAHRGWQYKRPDGQLCKTHYGDILSGDKLINNKDFKQELLAKYHDEPIGGEMEGGGVAAAADHRGTPWLIAKAISDWGDGKKNKSHQALAAQSSASFLHSLLSEKILDGMKKPESLDKLIKRWLQEKSDEAQISESS